MATYPESPIELSKGYAPYADYDRKSAWLSGPVRRHPMNLYNHAPCRHSLSVTDRPNPLVSEKKAGTKAGIVAKYARDTLTWP